MTDQTKPQCPDCSNSKIERLSNGLNICMHCSHEWKEPKQADTAPTTGPLPLIANECEVFILKSGDIVATTSTPELAAHIVKCVNAHEEILDALQAAYDEIAEEPPLMNLNIKKVCSALDKYRPTSARTDLAIEGSE